MKQSPSLLIYYIPQWIVFFVRSDWPLLKFEIVSVFRYMLLDFAGNNYLVLAINWFGPGLLFTTVSVKSARYLLRALPRISTVIHLYSGE